MATNHEAEGSSPSEETFCIGLTKNQTGWDQNFIAIAAFIFFFF